jgi:hypothetical protein
VSEEYTASIFSAEVEAVCSSETLVSTYKSTRRYNPEDNHRHKGVIAAVCALIFYTKQWNQWSYRYSLFYNILCTILIKQKYKQKIANVTDCSQISSRVVTFISVLEN